MVQPPSGNSQLQEEIIDLEASDTRPLLRARQRHSGEGAGGGSSGGAIYAMLPGVYADFWLCGTTGAGTQTDFEMISAALQEKRPDVLMTQLCPTRMKLMLDPSAPWWSNLDGTFGRFLSLLSGRWVLGAMGALAGGGKTMVGLEYVEVVRLAAQANVRVVLGERDLATSMQRGWKYMSWVDRLKIMRDLAVLNILPLPHSRWLMGLRQLSTGRGSDAVTEVMRLFVERCPSLARLEKEHHQYLLSSLQKLDSPGSSATRWPSDAEERTVVVAVMGKGTLSYVQSHWSDTVDRKSLVAKPVAGPGERVGLLVVVIMLILVATLLFLLLYKIFLSSLPLHSSSDPLLGVVP